MYLFDFCLFISDLFSQLLIQSAEGHELHLSCGGRVSTVSEGSEFTLEEPDLFIID